MISVKKSGAVHASNGSTARAQCLETVGEQVIAHATPFTDRFHWESPRSIQISRILILPDDVSFLSSEDLDPNELFSADSQFSILKSPFSINHSELTTALIRAIVLPDGLPLRLKALSLAGDIAKKLG